MNQPPTDWMSATAMLLCGLVLGFMFIISLRKKPAPKADLERQDLEAKRDALIARLREVEDDPEERMRLEREAAEVLRKLDARGAPAVSPAGPAAVPAAVSAPSQWRGFLWGSGSVAVVAAVLFFLTHSTKERGTNDGLTGGGPPATASAAAAAPDPALLQLEESVRKSPDDLELRHTLLSAYLERDNAMGVFEQTSAILQKSPNDARALTYQALVWARMGQPDRALQMLESATKADPSLLDAWVTLALMRIQSGDDRGAAAAIESAIKAHPEEEARLRDVLTQMRARAAEAPQEQAAAPAPSGPAIGVTLNVDPSVQVPSGAMLFVIVRAEGVTSGPPIAAKRLPAAGFPLSVSISQADSMMGQPLPDRVRLEARIDTDGVATTRDPSEPKAAQDGVAAGSTVSLTLK